MIDAELYPGVIISRWAKTRYADNAWSVASIWGVRVRVYFGGARGTSVSQNFRVLSRLIFGFSLDTSHRVVFDLPVQVVEKAQQIEPELDGALVDVFADFVPVEHFGWVVDACFLHPLWAVQISVTEAGSVEHAVLALVK